MKINAVQQSQQSNIYEPLPDGSYTRVLILEPGRRRQPLRCQLKIVNLEEDPDFEAISYVWGRGTKRKKVICNGVRLKITANLLQALVAVRYPSRPRNVWADSVSINQNDQEEKGRQVALMGPIFNRARRVLIHLAGDDGGHAHGVSTFVSEKLAIIRRQMPVDELATFPYPSAEETQLVLEDPRLQSIDRMLKHPWFERGWVIQEAVLARDSVIIWGARMTVGFDSFMICHSWLIRRFLSALVKYKMKSLNVLKHLYQYRFPDIARRLGLALTTQPSLLTIMNLARGAKFKDPRDRIYAFLYLGRLEDRLDVAVDATSRLTIQPDYSKSVAEVYADFARHCVKSGNIIWLHYIQHTQESLMDVRFASWVPRWDKNEHSSPPNAPSGHPISHPSHSTSGNRSEEIARFDGDCLIVQGFVFDRVRVFHCYPLFGSRSITLDDVASLWRTVRNSSMLGSAYSQEHLGLALFSTLTNNLVMPSMTQTEWHQEEEIFWHFLRAIEEDLYTPQSFAARMPHVELIISTISRGRKLVFTERGYFALAPRITEENDMCAVVFGCYHSFILREVECPSGSEQQKYRVVGDAWVAGKHAISDVKDGLYMSVFGQDSTEWETWGLKQGDIRLV